MGENSESPRRGVLLWVTPIAVAVTAFMYVYFDSYEWTTAQVVLQVALTAVSFGLLVATVSPRKGWWGLRVVTFVIFAAYLWYLIDMLWLSGEELEVTGRRSDATPFNALLGFLFFGVPCLLYTMWGSTWGRLGHVPPEETTRTDIVMYGIAWAAQALFLILSALVIGIGLLRTLGG